MKRVVIAPQAFKGSLSAVDVAEAVAAGISAQSPGLDLALIPVADGGEGTVEALLRSMGGETRLATVESPNGKPVQAAWGLSGTRAIIEMAAASGLPLVPRAEQDPEQASTFGTGQLLRAALDAGATEIIIGIGGSATNDGGAGALQAVGLRLLDAQGRDLPRGPNALRGLDSIDPSGLDQRLGRTKLRVMCDVANPLCGPEGATAVYGPQKGVTPEMAGRLDDALAHFAAVIRRDMGRDVTDVPGAGAAGGLGAGLLAIGGRLEPGAELVLDLADFDAKLHESDLVVTGEGRLDGQSAFGKSTIAVARRAQAAGLPVLAIVGGLGDGYETCFRHGISAVMSIAPGPISMEDAESGAARLVQAATERAFRLITLGGRVAGSRSL